MAQCVAVKSRTEVTEKESLLLTRNLLRIAVFNISYIRGLFEEKYFADTPIPGLDMKVKRLLPYDNEARRLIDWIEKGVYDALQKKYLRSMMFSICSGDDGPLIEEYDFSFTYPENSPDGCEMTIGRAGDKKSSKNVSSSDRTMKAMKKSVCLMVRTLIQLMRTLDNVPSERTIIMKLLYYDRTPEDYEPPYFRCCTEDDKVQWLKAPFKVKVGNVNSKHYAVALKVRSTLDPCEGENDHETDHANSTVGLVHTVGSEETRHGSHISKRPLSPTASICQPVMSKESIVPAREGLCEKQQSQDYMDIDRVKASKVQEPIYQPAKKLRSG